MSSTFARFKRNEFPLIEVEFTGEKETPQNFEAYLADLKENYAPQQAFVLLFDARQALSLNPKYQLKQAQWMKENEALIEKYCRGVAYVITNALLRNVLGLIFKIQKNPVPFKVFDKMPDARAWLLKHLD